MEVCLPDRGTLFRIWPATQTSIAWPAKTLSDFDAIYLANAFMNFVLKKFSVENNSPFFRPGAHQRDYFPRMRAAYFLRCDLGIERLPVDSAGEQGTSFMLMICIHPV